MSETPNARMLGLAAMLKWTKCGRGFRVLAFVLVFFPALCALCQAQDIHTVTNSAGVPLFEINFLNVDDPVGGVDSGEYVTRLFTQEERAAIIRAFDYWGQRLYPEGKIPPAAVGKVNVGYSSNTVANAYAADSNLYEALINGGAAPAEVCIGDMTLLGNWTTDVDGQITSMPGVPLDAVVIHELGHALGIGVEIGIREDLTYGVLPGPWADHVIPDPILEDINSTGPFYFNGDWAAEVYGDVWVPNSGNANRAIHLDGGYGFLADPNLLSHFDIRNALMTHQAYRNYTGFVEAELAALNDINYDINLRQFFGRSVYVNGQTITYSDGFFEHNGSKNAAGRYDAAGYLNGTYNTADYGVGLHVFADNTDITVTGNDILSIGDYGVGIRSDGAYNTIRIADDVSVHANGTNGTGLLVSFGLGSNVILQGDLQAAGVGGVGARFDFGYNILGYDITGTLGYGYTSGSLGGAIVDNFDISGTLVGDYAAIYIDDTARVDAINVLDGAVITGDIFSDSADVTRLTFGQNAVNGVADGTSSVSGFNYRHADTIDGNFDIETWSGTTTLDVVYDPENGQNDFIDVRAGFVGLGTADSTLVLPSNSSFGDMTVTMRGTLDGNVTGNMHVDDLLANAGLIHNFAQVRVDGLLRNAVATDEYGNVVTDNQGNIRSGTITGIETLSANSIENAGTIQWLTDIIVLSQPGVDGTENIPGTTTNPVIPPAAAIPAKPAVYGSLKNDGQITDINTITAGSIINNAAIAYVDTINVLVQGATDGARAAFSTDPYVSSKTKVMAAIAPTPDIYGNFINSAIERDYAGNITGGGTVTNVGTLTAGSITNDGWLLGVDTINVISKSATAGFGAIPATYTEPAIPATLATPAYYGTLNNNGIIAGTGTGTITAGTINSNGLIDNVDEITVISQGETPGFAATPGMGTMSGTPEIPAKPAVYGNFNVGSDVSVFDNQGNYVSGSVVQNVGNITTGNFTNEGLVAGIAGNIDVKKVFTNNGILAGVGGDLMVGESLINNGYLTAINEIQTQNFQNLERGVVAGVNTIVLSSNITTDPISARGTFVNQGGTIAVGNIEAIAGLIGQPEATGVSTLTIDGNFESTSGRFVVGLGQGLDTNEAFINVVNGNARISGGTVDIVIADGMNYLSDQKFTLISVDEGLGPANPYRLIVDPSAPLIAGDISDPLFTEFFNIAFDTDGMSFSLSATRSNTYSNIGTTMNQRAVGKYIDTATIYPSGDFRNVLLALKDTRAGAIERMQADSTYTITSDPIEACLAQMAGSIYGTETASSFRNTVMVHTTLANVLRRDYNHVSAATDAYLSGGMMRLPSDNLWGMVYGHAGSSQFDGNTNGYRQGFSGIMVGFDRKNDQRNRFGFFLSAGDGSLSSDLNDRSLSKELMLGHYFRKDTDSTYMLFQAGFGTHRYDTRRHMVFGSLETGNYINRTALNEHSSFLFTSHFETGLKYRGGIFNLSPYVGLEYTGLLREGFTENSAGSLNLTAEREDYHVIRPMFGLRFDSAPFRVQKALASFYGNVAWMYEFEANKRPSEFEAQFTEAGVFTGSTYTVHGNDPGRDWVQAGFGLNADLNTNLRVFAGYDAYANSQQVLHSASLGFMLQR